MPGVKRWGVNQIADHLQPLVAAGLQSILIFGVPDDKTKVSRLTKPKSVTWTMFFLPIITICNLMIFKRMKLEALLTTQISLLLFLLLSLFGKSFQICS